MVDLRQVNAPTITLTLIGTDVQFQLNGIWPPGQLYMAGCVLQRMGNKLIDEQELAQQQAMARMPQDLRRNDS